MNLLFHDLATTRAAQGSAVLTIEPGGNFVFSAGAARALHLAAGTTLALAEDIDATGRPWYLVLGNPAGHLNPFSLRTSGGETSKRLHFSSAATARKFFAAHPGMDPAKSTRLAIGTQPLEHPQAGQLWPLAVEGTGPVVASNPVHVPMRESFDLAGAGPCTDLIKSLGIVVEAPAPEPAAGQRRPWSAEEVATLRRLHPTTTTKDIAVQLGRTHIAVQIKASELLLKKDLDRPAKAVKPPVVPMAPQANNGRPKDSATDDINPGLSEKLTKVVRRLAPIKLFKMEEHEAKQALKLLTTHRDKLDWVPGAAKLYERLAGCYALPA
ncbi:hypothetical protein [Hymenobacter nivis]|uniref:Uncharacterized protein n=1 Tax=Hymenobacter nivis TaxID=1850093 RepID=A0A2Z3GRR0_9BACT|nr:hypothetical protein [Hymenobacter nivis]AWM31340.1 hypothetical protein DDQ68_00190 [Hymenobacter nivis]